MADHHVVVTGVCNRTHLVHVASYLRSLLTEACRSLTVAHVGGGRGLGRIVVSEQDVRALLPDDSRVTITFPMGAERWQLPQDRTVTYVAVGAPGLKPYARLLAATRGRPVRTVVTDEGLGSYGDVRTRRAAWQRQGVPQPWRTIRAAAVSAGLRVLTSQRWALYRETGAGWEVDQQVAAEFRRSTPAVAAADLAAVEVAGRAPGPAGDAVLLTQPWSDLGVVSAEAYRAHVAAVEAHVRERGLRLLVRPHPGEDPGFYGDFAVLADAIPAELDPRVTGAALVLGGPSTALLNLAAVHGRPARLTSPPDAELLSLLGARQRALFDRFVPDEELVVP